MSKIIIDIVQVRLNLNCNLNCPYCCFHANYYNDLCQYNLDQFEDDIINIKKFFNINNFQILGGEPLLNHQFFKYAEIIKKYMNSKITLFTNGILLDKYKKEDFNFFDNILITMYENTNLDYYNILKNLFNVTLLQVPKHKNTDINLTGKNIKKCKINSSSRCGINIYNGYLYLCCRPITTEYIRKNVYKEENVLSCLEVDGLKIDKIKSKFEILNYLYSTKPLNSCYYCKCALNNG